MPKVDFDLIRFDDKTKDFLNRKATADLFTKYLLAQNESKVISVNSAWGTGKTWFVHMWKNDLRDNHQSIIPIYYNAWENDDYEDAFIPLVAEISDQLKINDDSNYGAAFREVVGDLIVGITNSYIKEKTGFDMDLKGIFHKRKILFKQNNSKIFDDELEKYLMHNKAKIKFKEYIKKFAMEKDKIIFVFIDELDRCRPTFAIETLERIKHYFEIENVCFVLLQDSEQLSHSVRVIYGQDCDVDGYLRRFIDIEYNLPLVDWHEYIKKKNIEFSFKEELAQLAPFFPLTLRDFDKILVWFQMFEKIGELSKINFNKKENVLIFVFWVIYRIKHPLKYNDLISKNEFVVNKMTFKSYIYGNSIDDSIKVFETNTGLLNLFNQTMKNRNADTAIETYTKIANSKRFFISIPRLISIVDMEISGG